MVGGDIETEKVFLRVLAWDCAAAWMREAMICEVEFSEYATVIDIVNDAAQAYKGVIPSDCWKEPYMAADELFEEVDAGVDFYGWKEGDTLVAVMGIQQVKDVTLIRHAYVRSDYQRKGIGEKLLGHLLGLASTSEVLVGTWASAWWAIRFYEKHGFLLVPNEGLNKLRQYWKIPDRQAETSVVLRLEN
jgi:GNAT superfamily N-acetyltransferase